MNVLSDHPDLQTIFERLANTQIQDFGNLECGDQLQFYFEDLLELKIKPKIADDEQILNEYEQNKNIFLYNIIRNV